MGETQEAAHVLSRGEDRHSLRGDLPDGLAEPVRHQPREPQERVVQTEQARPRHEAAGQGEHLLLASRKDAGGRRRLFLEHREEAEDQAEGLLLLAVGPGQEGAELEVLADGQGSEEPPPLGDQGDAARRDGVRRQPVDPLAVEPDGAGVDGQQPGDGLEQRRLPRAVGADERDELARPHLEGTRVEHAHVVVAGLDRLDLEERTRHGPSSSPRYAWTTRGEPSTCSGRPSATIVP